MYALPALTRRESDGRTPQRNRYRQARHGFAHTVIPLTARWQKLNGESDRRGIKVPTRGDAIAEKLKTARAAKARKAAPAILPQSAPIAAVPSHSAIISRWRAGMATFAGSSPPCPGCGPDQWARIRRAAARFLDEFGDRAAALAWGTRDLFGVDPGGGLLKPERCGAMMRSNGRAITAVDDRKITFEDGGTFERSSRESPSIAVWEFRRG
jgi:hypothetical protein